MLHTHYISLSQVLDNHIEWILDILHNASIRIYIGIGISPKNSIYQSGPIYFPNWFHPCQT